MKTKKTKSKSISYLKKKTWSLFSEFIRKRGCSHDGINTCVTCGINAHWKDLQAGHFIDGRNNSVLFNEEIVWPQCMRCNIFLKGNKIQYVQFMVRTLGKSFDDLVELDKLKFLSKQFKKYDYLDLIELYINKITLLNRNINESAR